MLRAIVLLSLAVISSAAGNSFVLPKAISQKKFFQNEKWTTARVAPIQPLHNKLSVVGGETLKNMVASQWPNNAECLGNTDIGSGYAQNVCMTAYDNAGNAVGSGISMVTANGPFFTNVTYTEYDGTSCDGKATFEEVKQYPKFCVPGDSGDSSIRLQFTESVDVQSHFRNGLLFQYYDTKEHCSSSSAVSTSFVWFALNYCFKNDDGTSTRFPACSGSQISVQAFTDPACTSLSFEGSFDAQTCAANEDGSDDRGSGALFNSFYSHHCT